ncbi:MAG: MTAP family purine nucleoside phosphorylase [Jatrophihabitans sp.]
MDEPVVAIIGGTGFYEFLSPIREVNPETPWGPTSAPITLCSLQDRLVAFMPRHGRNHDYLPHEIPYRANIWAFKELGARQILGLNTVGSLQYDYRRGDLVLVDQFIDRTSGRIDTYFSGSQSAHISSAYPYCQRMRGLANTALQGTDRYHDSATVVVTQGPRFNTVAESRWFRSQGWQVLNMTQYPEVVLAREQELCYMNLSYVTDYDVAMIEVVGSDEPDRELVSHARVLQAFGADTDRFNAAVARIVAALPADFDCSCRHALDGART